MDIRSMLHDEAPAAAKPPPPPPAQDQSLQQRSQSYGAQSFQNQPQRERPSSYGPPLQPPSDPRSPHAGGGYFTPQSSSSYQNSAVSVGTHSFHSQSPGTHSQLSTPRDPYTPNQQQYGGYPAQSPSMLAQPQTPGGPPQHYNQFANPPSAYGSGPQQVITNHSQSSREYPPHTNGTPSQKRHISPEVKYHHHPATSLGPPASFPKPLSQNQRPPLGPEHYRTYSSGSISSLTTREPAGAYMPSPEQPRRESIQRQMSADRERERSISVSPKTIPQSIHRPSPLRQPSGENHLQRQLTPPAGCSTDKTLNKLPSGSVASAHSHHQTPPPSIGYGQPREQQTPSQLSSTRSSPSLAGNPVLGSQPMTTSPSANLTTQYQPSEQSSLKRGVSAMSDLSDVSQPARKRPRRDEIPIFARSARPNNPPRLSRTQGPIVQHRTKDTPFIKEEPLSSSQMASNGTAQQNPLATGPIQDPIEGPWELSILNITPYEDLTRTVCDWIVHRIGGATPPPGAMFEIEAKLGEIVDSEEQKRIRLPVDTEAVFNKDMYRMTKFESTMNAMQHKRINEFLNDLVMQIHNDPNRTPLLYDHPHEADEFFELLPDGEADLPHSLRHWVNKRHAPKVRITTDLKTNTRKAQIIKSRIADLEIYNPRSSFDLRLSISLESPWDGQMKHLRPIGDGSNDRMKDRMSYRHGAYQIDLTQISYTDRSKPQQHELEVEISTELIRKELDNLKANRPSRYEELVRGFIDNVRILCRRATIDPPLR